MFVHVRGRRVNRLVVHVTRYLCSSGGEWRISKDPHDGSSYGEVERGEGGRVFSGLCHSTCLLGDVSQLFLGVCGGEGGRCMH